MFFFFQVTQIQFPELKKRVFRLIKEQKRQKLPFSCLSVQQREHVEGEFINVKHKASNGWR